MLRWIQTIRYHLIDLHDPSGVHFHRAWKACLAGLFAAALLYFMPRIGQPLAVVAAMIFAHTTSGANPHKQQITLLRAALLTISGICLLSLVSHLPADPDLDKIQRLSRMTQKSVYQLDQHLEGRKHESIMSSNSLSQRLALIEGNKRIYESLLYLSYLACHAQPGQPLPPEAQMLIGQITVAFEEMQTFIGTRFSPQLPLMTSRYRLPHSEEGENLNQSQLNFLLALNPLCDAIEQYGEMRQLYSVQQTQPIQHHET